MQTPSNASEFSWAAIEFATVALGDTRLNRRCSKVQQLWAKVEGQRKAGEWGGSRATRNAPPTRRAR